MKTFSTAIVLQVLWRPVTKDHIAILSVKDKRGKEHKVRSEPCATEEGARVVLFTEERDGTNPYASQIAKALEFGMSGKVPEEVESVAELAEKDPTALQTKPETVTEETPAVVTVDEPPAEDPKEDEPPAEDPAPTGPPTPTIPESQL